ncbi:MAG: Ku protein [Micrococcales bacterium]|nr:Ku protein [Micrococcales bacterium]
MRAIWKGAVSFGLVSVPVRLYSATESHDLQFRQVRKSDGSRIRYRRVAEADGEEVAYRDIGKGYESEDGRMVILTEEDLASLPSRSSKEISVEKFVPAAQIDPIMLDRTYYLEPDKAAVKPYALLREALRESDRVAIVTVSVRTRLTTAVLRAVGDVIVMQTMLWPDEIREAEFDVLEDVPEPKPAEKAMATMLVDSMAGDFDPDEYEDDYRGGVEALVAAKLAGGDSVAAPVVEEEGGEVVDLLAALQASVERAKKARGGPADGASEKPAGGADGDESGDGGDTGTAKKASSPTTKKATAATSAKNATKTAKSQRKAG